MNCEFDRELLSLYADGALKSGLLLSVEDHISGCADCRRELEEIRMIGTTLSNIPREAAPLELIDRILREHSDEPAWVTLGRSISAVWKTAMQGFRIEAEREARLRRELPEWVARWVLFI